MRTAKLVPRPSPALDAVTRATVQLDEVPGDRKAETETRMPPGDRSIGLPEAFEQMRQKIRLDPGSVIVHLYDDVGCRRGGP